MDGRSEKPKGLDGFIREVEKEALPDKPAGA
jgi:hypothetical protein